MPHLKSHGLSTRQTVVVHAPNDTRPDRPVFPLDFNATTRPGIGNVILGHYEVLDALGRGGFGVVVRARDLKLDRLVAVKMLAAEHADNEEERRRFLREARSVAAVRHENVVQIHTVDDDPIPHLVMELIEGESLQAKLDRGDRFSPAQVVRIGGEIAHGLAAAHQRGIIHRDIKPANILIESGPAGRLKLTDFGLARGVDDTRITQSGIVAGTPMYMAPEQAADRAVDHRADLFSLGSVLYELCTGQPPFPASNTYAVMRRVVDDEARPIREIAPDVPVDLAALIERLHAKDPGQRIATATEVADRLAACNLDPPSTAPRRSPRPYRRRVAATAALAVVGLAIAVAANGLTSRTPAGEPPRPEVSPVGDLLTSTDWTWGEPENLGPGVNGHVRDSCPTLTTDELVLVFNRDEHIYMSRRASVAERFGPAVPVSSTAGFRTRGAASLTGDGLELFFCATAEGPHQIWVAKRATRDEPFGEPVCLPAPVRHIAGILSPTVSADGHTLLATPLGAAGLGKGDIAMYTRRTRTEPFANEIILPAPVSTPSFDTAC